MASSMSRRGGAQQPARAAAAAGPIAPRARPRWLVAIAIAALVLAIAGTGISTYLAIENLQGQSGVCTVVHGCSTVQQSSYGKILGIPVSVPGLALYVLLAVGAATWLTNFRGLGSQVAFLAFNGALFGFLFSLYLTYIEGWVLEAWCIYCIVSATLMTLLMLSWLGLLTYEVRSRRST